MFQNEFVIGFDEVGRGCVAGPVTVGLVAIPSHFPLQTYISGGKYNKFKDLQFVRDSKKLSLIKRQKVVSLIQKYNFPNLILNADNQLIDEFGIGVCLSHLLQLGYTQLQNMHPESSFRMIADGKITILKSLNSDLLIELYKQNPNLQKHEFDFTKHQILRENFADDKYLSVALASSLAKVYRDNLMIELNKRHPEYDWQTNKGYATKKHLQSIRDFPVNEYLRMSFLTRQIPGESLFTNSKL